MYRSISILMGGLKEGMRYMLNNICPRTESWGTTVVIFFGCRVIIFEFYPIGSVRYKGFEPVYTIICNANVGEAVDEYAMV